MPRRFAPIVVPAVVLLIALAMNHRHDARAGGVRSDGDTIQITPEIRRAGLSFGPEVAPSDRAWILAAIAHARPEAQRLVHEVDGLVTVNTGGTGSMIGYARSMPNGYQIWLNVSRLDGSRKLDRDVAVLHELGHVVDFTLIADALDRTLDDGIPRGGHCDLQDGVAYGDCAPPEERLADTFAKWALGGAVSAVGSGYAIANPPSLDDWGMPLVTLAASLPN
jgi:hypothetical protein